MKNAPLREHFSILIESVQQMNLKCFLFAETKSYYHKINTFTFSPQDRNLSFLLIYLFFTIN